MIKDHIKSIRQSVGREYTRPDPSKIDVFIENLHNNKEAQDYLLKERGFTQETIDHFKLGYEPDKNAISIPIYKEGELINVKYRFLEPKDIRYVSEKNAETWLYNDAGLVAAKKNGGVLVVEGEFDAMSAWQAGVENVVSTASGKDSYGVWIALMDEIPRVYVAFDNDEGGKASGRKFADRIGVNKSYEFNYPDGIKDANEYFKENTLDDFKSRVKLAQPYYSYQYKNVGDIIQHMMNGEEKTIESEWIPRVKLEKDWLVVLSGDTNVGKTTYSLNVAKDFALKDIPVLILPFERGSVSVGKRFLQIFFGKSNEEMSFTSKEEWGELIDKVVDVPIYFATPKKNDTVDTIRKSVRFFNTKVVIIDHLDYIIRHTGGNRENEISNTLQDYKRLAEELGVIFIVVTHLKKRENVKERPHLNDLKGSSSLSQDPECVVLLSSELDTEDGGTSTITVDVAKNKGTMGAYKFGVTNDTGVLDHDPDKW
jgi:hypothetical protein